MDRHTAARLDAWITREPDWYEEDDMASTLTLGEFRSVTRDVADNVPLKVVLMDDSEPFEDGDVLNIHSAQIPPGHPVPDAVVLEVSHDGA